MKTSELREKLEDMGYYLVERDSAVDVTNKYLGTLIHIDNTDVASLDSDWECFKILPDNAKLMLLDLATEYAKTPISKRVNVQLYHIQFPLLPAGEDCLNFDRETGEYDISDSEEFNSFKTMFTKDEIEAIDERLLAFAVPVKK